MFESILIHFYNYAESYTVFLIWVSVPLEVYLGFLIFRNLSAKKDIPQVLNVKKDLEKPLDTKLPKSDSKEALNLLTQAMSELFEDEKKGGEKGASN